MSLRKMISAGGQALLLAVLATGTFASATPITGTLNIAGTAVVSAFEIDFIPPPNAGVGEIAVLPGGNTGDFAFLNAGFTTGLLVDRDASQQAGIPLNVPDWLTIPNFSFTLEFIRPGSFSSTACFDPPANQQNCTPPPNNGVLSPYNLTNAIDATGNVSAKASFFVTGTVTNLLNPLDIGKFEGEFTTTLLNVSYQQLLNTVIAGGTITTPFSATFEVTPIPEPSSLALALGGALLAGLGSLRRRK
jgi:hypothetical protein